jgi:hypothetical protein
MDKFNLDRFKLKQLIGVAFRSLLQRKLRSLLSVLGVVCGVMAVVAMISVGEGAKQKTISQIEQLGTKNIYIRAVGLTDDQMVLARERLSYGLTTNDMQRLEKGCATAEKIAGLWMIRASMIGLPQGISPRSLVVRTIMPICSVCMCPPDALSPRWIDIAKHWCACWVARWPSA